MVKDGQTGEGWELRIHLVVVAGVVVAAAALLKTLLSCYPVHLRIRLASI